MFSKIFAPLIRDLIGVGGIGLIAYGLHLIYPPAAYIFVGGVMVAIVMKLSKE